MSLVLEGVSARHPAAPASTFAVQAIDLAFATGEQVALIGPSGAGKTTLLAVCGLQLRPAAGRVLVDDIDPWMLSSRARHALRRTFCVAPQVPPLPPRQRVVTSVLAARLPGQRLVDSLASLVRPTRAHDAFDALDAFGLGAKLWDRVDRLSGGERQRVSLARLLVADAARWLVDEPLSALDPALAGQAIGVLVDGARSRTATLVASLHQVDLAMQWFPRLVGLSAGRIVFDRAAADVDADLRAALYALAAPAAVAPGAAAAAPARPKPGCDPFAVDRLAASRVG